MSLQFSYIEENQKYSKNSETNQISEKNENRLEKVRTMLKQDSPQSFLQEEETSLADFKYSPQEEKSKTSIDKKREIKIKEEFRNQDLAVDNENQLSPYAYSNEYYKNLNSQQTSNQRNQDDLLEKLNYMIHLLEHEKQQKSENIAEELILYLFLGIFIIYILDSFAKIGKYIR